MALHGAQALQESFDEVAKNENIGLKDLQPFTAYEWLLTDVQKTKFQEIGKQLYLSAAKKRHATMVSKDKEKRAKKLRVDDRSEADRVKSLFTSR